MLLDFKSSSTKRFTVLNWGVNELAKRIIILHSHSKNKMQQSTPYRTLNISRRKMLLGTCSAGNTAGQSSDCPTIAVWTARYTTMSISQPHHCRHDKQTWQQKTVMWRHHAFIESVSPVASTWSGRSYLFLLLLRSKYICAISQPNLLFQVQIERSST